MKTETLDLNTVSTLLGYYQQLLNAKFIELSVLGAGESDAAIEINRQMRLVSGQLSIIEGAKVSTVELEQWSLPEAQDVINYDMTNTLYKLGGGSSE